MSFFYLFSRMSVLTYEDFYNRKLQAKEIISAADYVNMYNDFFHCNLTEYQILHLGDTARSFYVNEEFTGTYLYDKLYYYATTRESTPAGVVWDLHKIKHIIFFK